MSTSHGGQKIIETQYPNMSIQCNVIYISADRIHRGTDGRIHGAYSYKPGTNELNKEYVEGFPENTIVYVTE
jgi:hypothetical protein